MTSWRRKQIAQHKELQHKKYRQRVVPLEKREALLRQRIREAEKEIEETVDELDIRGTQN